MRSLSDPEVVQLWEEGRSATPLTRATRLLSVATGDPHRVRTLTPGESDTHLLTLRRLMFGSALDCVSTCPSCGEPLEFALDANELTPVDESEEPRQTQLLRVARDGYRATVRLPTLEDLDSAAALQEDALLARCLVSAERDGAAIAASDLPASVIAAIDDELAVADAGAIIELSLDCPSCAHTWTQLFDIVSFLWAEIQTRGERLVREVHVLARAYSWTEREILAVPPIRRARYLELAGGAA
jgi:hypothetical protein